MEIPSSFRSEGRLNLLVDGPCFLFHFLDNYNNTLKYEAKINQIRLNHLKSQLNPHFIHNSLNAIQYYIQRNEVEISENYLTKFSKLMRMFFEYSKKASITIRDEVTLLKTYLEIEKLRFEDKIEYTIEVDDELNQDSREVPTMLIQPIVENAINHGLFHKKGEGKVEVHFKYINVDTYKILVRDDGIGLNKALELRPKGIKRLNSSKVIAERLLLLKKSEQVDIEQEVIDLSDISPQTGTQVSLTITQKDIL